MGRSEMPVILGLIAGGLGGYGTYHGWLTDLGLPSEVLDVAILVGILLFLIGTLGGLFVFVIGDQ
jgi:hypothetical protein